MHRTTQTALVLMVGAVLLIAGCTDQSRTPTSPTRIAGPHFDAIAEQTSADSDWVSTPGGWYHKTCVHLVPQGSYLDAAHSVVYNSDGTSIKYSSCKYAHGQRRGVNGVGGRSAPPPSLDGWINDEEDNASPGQPTWRSIDAYWHVPGNPSESYSSGQVYYTFPGLQDDTLIMQPVLAYHYNSTVPGWAIGSWNCGNPTLNCFHSSLVGVSPGDSIYGFVHSSSCSSGSCNWLIKTLDVTTGSWTQLSVTSGADDFRSAVASAIEVHGPLNTCFGFPSAPIKTTGISLANSSGAVTPSWGWVNYGPSPDCGWAHVVNSSTSVTLTNLSPVAFISGETPVNTGNNCQYDATVYGGLPGYTYSWSTDGTILSGQNTAQITVRFSSDGSHFVSVTVTDALSETAGKTLNVTSQTSDPPQVTCSVT